MALLLSIISILYLVNILFVTKLIFHPTFKHSYYSYTYLFLLLLPVLTPFFMFLIFLDESVFKRIKLNQRRDLALKGSSEIFSSGEKFFDDLMKEIDQAKHYILINLFLFNSDQIGNEIIEALVDKQRKGVDVVLIYDALARVKLKLRALKPLKKAGAQVIAFMPIFIRKRLLNLNVRNHRKFIMIDHRIAYLGGFNIGDEYLGRKRLGIWADLEVKITGDVRDLLTVVNDDLKIINKTLKHRILTTPFETAGKLEVPHAFPIVSSGLERSSINSTLFCFLELIYSAKASIQLMTPYLVMTDCLLDALLFQASKDVKIDLIIPSKNDHVLTNNASRAMAKRILHPNIHIHLYSEKGFMHAKTLFIDEARLFVTSANVDYRSVYYNLELGLLIEEPSSIQTMKTQFEIKKKQSKLFTKEDCRLRDQLALFFAIYL